MSAAPLFRIVTPVPFSGESGVSVPASALLVSSGVSEGVVSPGRGELPGAVEPSVAVPSVVVSAVVSAFVSRTVSLRLSVLVSVLVSVVASVLVSILLVRRRS